LPASDALALQQLVVIPGEIENRAAGRREIDREGRRLSERE
jgi:hypothetical protein